MADPNQVLGADQLKAAGAGYAMPAQGTAVGNAEVRAQSEQVKKLQTSYNMITALLGGTAAMRAAAEEYLPKWPKEEPLAYTARLKQSTLTPLFERTVEVLAAKPLSEPPTMSEGVSDTMEEMLEDVDKQGSSLEVFTGAILTESLSYGFGGILVDAPKVKPKADGSPRTKADDQNEGVRPYFVLIHGRNVLGWKSAVENGAPYLTQLRLLECVEEDDGEYGTKSVEQVRVLEIGKWRTFRKKKDASGKEAWTQDDEGTYEGQKRIQFFPFYGKYCGFMMGEPPMANIAYMNVEHWQSKSDQRNILHTARVPIMALIGAGDATLVVGTSSAIRLDVGGDAKYIEHSGKAIEAGRVDLDEIEDDCRQAGAELLVIKPGNTSIPQTLADNEPGQCTLQRIGRLVEKVTNQALESLHEWAGETGDAPEMDLFDDYGVQTIDAAAGEFLLKMNAAGKLSDETLFKEAQRRNMIDSEISWDDEQERIQSQNPLGGPGGTTATGDGSGSFSIVKRPDGFYVIDGNTGDDAGGPFPDQEKARIAMAELEGAAGAQNQPAGDKNVTQGNPYKVVKRGNKFAVIKVKTGETLKSYPDKASAMRYFRALEANVHDA